MRDIKRGGSVTKLKGMPHSKEENNIKARWDIILREIYSIFELARVL